MKRLAGQQHEFLAALLGDAPTDDVGMAVYRRNVLGARHGALAGAYPVVQRLVGDAFFREAAERFARATPSASGDLHAYGLAFADFLAAYPYARSLEYLPDVARLEWAVHEARHAADGRPFDFAALARAAQDPGNLRLHLHPAVRLVQSPHPILALWEANQADRDGTVGREGGPDHVLVRREGYAVVPVAVDANEWTLLQAFARGATLDRACAALGQAADSFPHALRRLAVLGALGGFEAGA